LDVAATKVRMPGKNHGILPPELARKISPWTVNGAEMTGTVGKTALTGIVAFLLYPVGSPYVDHNGFVCLLGPWVFPMLIAFLWSVRLKKLPFRIFRGSPFAAHAFVDTGEDPAIMRLAALCKSEESRRHLWHEGLRMSTILFVILGTAAFLQRDSIDWAYPSSQNHFLSTARPGEPGSWFWMAPLGCPIITFLILSSDHIRWCLMTWAKRESASAKSR
jgi:hypothetical protein